MRIGEPRPSIEISLHSQKARKSTLEDKSQSPLSKLPHKFGSINNIVSDLSVRPNNNLRTEMSQKSEAHSSHRIIVRQKQRTS